MDNGRNWILVDAGGSNPNQPIRVRDRRFPATASSRDEERIRNINRLNERIHRRVVESLREHEHNAGPVGVYENVPTKKEEQGTTTVIANLEPSPRQVPSASDRLDSLISYRDSRGELEAVFERRRRPSDLSEPTPLPTKQETAVARRQVPISISSSTTPHFTENSSISQRLQNRTASDEEYAQFPEGTRITHLPPYDSVASNYGGAAAQFAPRAAEQDVIYMNQDDTTYPLSLGDDQYDDDVIVAPPSFSRYYGRRESDLTIPEGNILENQYRRSQSADSDYLRVKRPNEPIPPWSTSAFSYNDLPTISTHFHPTQSNTLATRRGTLGTRRDTLAAQRKAPATQRHHARPKVPFPGEPGRRRGTIDRPISRNQRLFPVSRDFPRRNANTLMLRRPANLYDKCDLCALKLFRPGDSCGACGRGLTYGSANQMPLIPPYFNADQILNAQRLAKDQRSKFRYIRGRSRVGPSRQPQNIRSYKRPVFRYGTSLPESLYDYEVWARKKDRRSMQKRAAALAIALLAIALVVSAGVVLAAVNN